MLALLLARQKIEQKKRNKIKSMVSMHDSAPGHHHLIPLLVFQSLGRRVCPTAVLRGKKWDSFVRALIQREQVRARSREHLLARRAGIARRFFQRAPSEDRHELALGRAVFRCDRCSGLAQTVRRAVLQTSFIAALAEPVAEAVWRKRSGVKQQRERKPRFAADRTPLFKLPDVFEGPAIKSLPSLISGRARPLRDCAARVCIRARS